MKLEARSQRLKLGSRRASWDSEERSEYVMKIEVELLSRV
jgi:hypothetical protein